MTENLLLAKIITPSSIVFESNVSMVNIPGVDGIFGVLPGHASLISSVKQGIVKIFDKNNIYNYFVDGAVAHVTGQELRITTEFAIDINKVDKSIINNQLDDLQKQLRDQNSSISEDSKQYFIGDIIKNKIEKYQNLLNYIV